MCFSSNRVVLTPKKKNGTDSLHRASNLCHNLLHYTYWKIFQMLNSLKNKQEHCWLYQLAKKKRLKKERVKTMKWLKHCVLGLCQFSGRTATVHAGNLLKHHKDQISFKTDLFLLSKLHKRKRGREKTQTCESINKKIIKKSAFTSWTADVILLFNIKWLFLL